MVVKRIICFSLVVMILLMGLPVWGAPKLFKIAVLPFDDGSIKDRWWGNSWELGKGVSDELVTALLNTGQFRMIEREQIDKVLQEQNFGSSGRVDTKSAARIGKILGVQYLVMGRVTEFSTKSSGGSFLGDNGFGLGIKTTVARVVIDARLVDTTTAEIVAGLAGKGEKSNTNLGLTVNWNSMAFGSDEFEKTNLGIALREAVNQTAGGLAATAYENINPNSLVAFGSVFYVKGSTVIINLGSTDGIQPGKVFIVDHVIDTVKDPDTGEVVDQITEPVAEILVKDVKEKTSTCVISRVLNKKYAVALKDVVRQK